MARNENRRRKKLEAKKKKSSEKKRQISRQRSAGTAGTLRAAAGWPVVASKMILPQNGMSRALMARRGPSGMVVFCEFLVDTWLLGVKNVVVHAGPQSVYADYLDRSVSGRPMENVNPEHLCHFVLGAVNWAESWGFPPHRDFEKAAMIFGDLIHSEDDIDFEYGFEGRPMYMSGPHDSPARQRQIIATLEGTAGVGNFDFAVGADSLDEAASVLRDVDVEFDEDRDDDSLLLTDRVHVVE